MWSVNIVGYSDTKLSYSKNEPHYDRVKQGTKTSSKEIFHSFKVTNKMKLNTRAVNFGKQNNHKSTNSDGALKKGSFCIKESEPTESLNANDVLLVWGGPYMDSSLYLFFRLY